MLDDINRDKAKQDIHLIEPINHQNGGLTNQAQQDVENGMGSDTATVLEEQPLQGSDYP